VVLKPEEWVMPTLHRWNAKIQSLVKNSRDKRIHLFFTTIQPGGGSHGLYSHVGEEFGLVLKGVLEIDINRTVYTVRENESFYYN
jgi:uncharacterized cupin superfamily protein